MALNVSRPSLLSTWLDGEPELTAEDDAEYAATVLLEYLEEHGNTPAIEELVSCILADSAVRESRALRQAVECFGVILGSRVEV